MREEQTGINVLHVDDEPNFLALTKAFLERENREFSIDTATSAEEGFELLKSGKYGVVVSDYKMPVIDGLEFLKTLRASGNTIPFIMFTGKGREEVAIEALNRGANHYLQKGTDIASMYGTLAHAIIQEVETKRVEDALQESEEKYRLITESTSDFISKTTFNLKVAFTYISPSITKVMGYEPEDLIGKSAFSFIHPDDKKNLIRLLKGYVSAKLKKYFVTKGRDVSETIEYRFPDKSGKWRYIQSTANIIGDELLFVSRDVTERKRMENTLKEAEERYRTTFENTGTAMCVIEEDQTISLINNEFEKLSGWLREEIEGEKKWPEFVVKEDLERMKKYHHERRKEEGKAPTSYEFGFINRKGNIKNIYLSIEVIPGTKRSVCSLIDLTERKRAEETLRVSALQWQTCFDAITDSVCLLDLGGRFLRCNKATAELLGKPVNEILGRTCWELVQGTSEPIEGCPIVRMLETHHRESLVLPVDDRWLDVSADPVLDENGKLIGAVHIISDITERKQAEKALKESEEKYHNLVERANDGITLIQDNIVRYANPRLAEMWGGTVEEVIGTPFTDHIPPDEIPKVVDRYKRRMTGGDVTPIYETVLRRKDGSEIYVELNAGIITFQGKPADLVFIRDITERKVAEKAIMESEEEYRSLV